MTKFIQLNNKRKIALPMFFFMGLVTFATQTLASEKHDNNSDEHEALVIDMSTAMSDANDIKTAKVGSGTLNQTAMLYGSIATDPASLSHIRARFDGLVVDVKVNIGDRVKKDDVLARVESNESLKRYAITAPFDGEVIARHANAGELSNGQVLFSIANYDRVWAELALFPSQIANIKVGQTVSLGHSSFNQTSQISHITAPSDKLPHSLVFASLDNVSRKWPVGTLVTATVNTADFDVAIRVPLSAIQEIEDEPVVFIKEVNGFHASPVKLGRSDNTFVEVLDGVVIGDLVVVENSFLLKADIEKSEAGHDH